MRRDNRFRVTVRLEGREVAAHLPNSGRLGELLTPETTCYLVPRPSEHRLTAYDLVLVAHAGILVCVDARLPNRLFAEAAGGGLLPPFDEVTSLDAEVRSGPCRLDFRLTTPKEVWWVETKSVTLVEDGLALFPDAPTERGRRHLQELADRVRSGQRGAAVFLVQRADASAFAPHARANPAFAQELAKAVDAGVEVYAFRCAVTRHSVEIASQLPVKLCVPPTGISAQDQAAD